jgi:Cof subfamily protein (haloacid dehalogenase superfamily)
MPKPIKPIKLIAVDVDGTLLNSQHELTERTIQALRRAAAQGVQVVVATGRPRFTVLGVLSRLGLAAPGVFLQGLALYDADGTLRYEQVMDHEVARQVIEFAEAGGYSLIVYNSNNALVRTRTRHMEAMVVAYDDLFIETGESLRNLPGKVPISKVIFVDGPDRIETIRAKLSPRLNGSAKLVRSQPTLLEALPINASKGAGLERLLSELRVPLDEVLAIGDAENDIEMLQLVGVGVAMGNAPQAVKDAAAFVTADNDSDGVAEAVERFVLAPLAAKTARTSST